MKILEIHYQTNRVVIPNSCYYPEDIKTPRQRVDYVMKLKNDKEILMEPFILVSACPYIIEAFVTLFKETEIKCFIDNKSVDIQDIFKEMATPMKDLISID